MRRQRFQVSREFFVKLPRLVHNIRHERCYTLNVIINQQSKQ